MRNGKTAYLLLSLDCRPILVPVRPLHRHRRTRQAHLRVQHQSKVTNPHQETGAIHQKLKTKYKEGWQSRFGRPFARPCGMVRGVHRKSRRYRRACTRNTFLMTQIRNGLQKWHPRSTVFLLTSRKIEIARSPRSQGPLAEDEMANQYLEQKSLVT